jgi:HAD superfamily hydrolase (TIGR01509 family)
MRPNVIFDCDGVLVDSEPISNRVLAAMLTDLGLPTTAEESMAAHLGRAWPSVAELIEARLGRPLAEDFRPRYVEGMLAAFERELEPVPGIVEALDAIDNPSCVASSGAHEKMRMTLAHTGLLERFEGRIFSATEVARGKPAPDLFLHAAERMGWAPEDCVVVEDSAAGVEAARAAGMRALGYAGRTDPALLAGSEVFTAMAELPALLQSPPA